QGASSKAWPSAWQVRTADSSSLHLTSPGTQRSTGPVLSVVVVVEVETEVLVVDPEPSSVAVTITESPAHAGKRAARARAERVKEGGTERRCKFMDGPMDKVRGALG